MKMKRNRFHVTLAVVVVGTLSVAAWLATHAGRIRAEESVFRTAPASDADDSPNAPPVPSPDDAKSGKAVPKLPAPKGAKPLARGYDVWIDPEKKAVIVDGQVSLREGMLEMFACTRNTKEHESIVSVNSKAYLIHAALLSLGAEQGRPAQFVPKYRPPSGTEIEVTVEWRDERGKSKTARAQDWILDINTKKPMTHPFVFAGSSFWTDEETGKKFYQAEGGDLICVSNFSTAMLDIPVESSPENSELAFEAYAKRIPPLGAPVRLILKPKVKKSESQPGGIRQETTSKDSEDTTEGEDKAAKTDDTPKSEKDETQ